jgi:hypothetical protein
LTAHGGRQILRNLIRLRRLERSSLEGETATTGGSETGQVGDEGLDLVHTRRLAMRTIRRNLLVSLAYNVLAGALVAAGFMTPLVAAIIVPASSATVLALAVASVGLSTPHKAAGRALK